MIRVLAILCLTILTTIPLLGQTLPWEQVSAVGFDSTNNLEAASLVSMGSFLWVGTRNDTEGAALWKTSDQGASWAWSIRYGMGDANNTAISSMAVFNSYVHMGTWNLTTGAEMWRRPEFGSPAQVNVDGFGASTNEVIQLIQEFNGYLYAGIWDNSGTGAEVWRSSDGTTWTQCNVDGFGDGNNRSVQSMAVMGSYLYAGTFNNVTGLEIWRTSNGTSWTQVGTDGLGSSANRSAGAMEFYSYEDKLWVATNNETGSQVWWSSDGMTFYQFGTMFGSTVPFSMAEFDRGLYIAANGSGGGAVWRKRSTSFVQVNVPGFGNSNNTQVKSLAVHDGVLFAGTRNTGGCEIWALPIIFSDGFESGDFTSW